MKKFFLYFYIILSSLIGVIFFVTYTISTIGILIDDFSIKIIPVLILFLSSVIHLYVLFLILKSIRNKEKISMKLLLINILTLIIMLIPVYLLLTSNFFDKDKW